MTTRSIFQKVCPGCMSTIPLDSRECSCGHPFDHEDMDESLSSEEIRLKAEELYESYLAARAEQATNAAKSARSEFARDPSNPENSDRVASAMQEAKMAEAALAAHAARVAEMRAALRATARPPVLATPVASVKRAMPPLKPASMLRPVRAARKAVTTNVVNAAVAASTRAKRAHKTVVPLTPKIPVKPAPAPTKPEVALPVQTATPNIAFRQAQAARAEKIVHKVQEAKKPVAAMAKEKTPSRPVAEPKAKPVASAQTRNAPRLYALDNKDCPNCTSSVAKNVSRCRCGYEFPSSEQLIPPLSMSDEERAEFAKLFSYP